MNSGARFTLRASCVTSQRALNIRGKWMNVDVADLDSCLSAWKQLPTHAGSLSCVQQASFHARTNKNDSCNADRMVHRSSVARRVPLSLDPNSDATHDVFVVNSPKLSHHQKSQISSLFSVSEMFFEPLENKRKSVSSPVTKKETWRLAPSWSLLIHFSAFLARAIGR